MAAYNVYEAKTHLSALLDQAVEGEEVIISRAGKPMVKLTPIQDSSKELKPRQFGHNFLGITFLKPDWQDDLPIEDFDALRES